MRLCNALIYILLISLSLFFNHCHGHEHHNHVDPVTSKLAESTVTVDQLTNPLETANIQKTNFQEHQDDEHQHDTIEARLQAKHNLRQSVHQHVDDDKEESEEEYINRLNSALEDEYQPEHHFQYAAQPIADTNKNTSVQNQANEDIQVSIHSQNETTSSMSTSVQTPTEQEKQRIETSTVLDSSRSNSIQDEISNKKIVSQETIVPPVQIPNVVNEDIITVHQETITSMKIEQQQQQDKHTVDSNPTSFNQQSSVINITVEPIVQKQASSHVKSTTVQTVTNSQTDELNAESETLQQTVPIDVNPIQQEVKVETISTTPPSNVRSEQTKTLETKTDQQQQSIEVMDSVITPSTSTRIEQQQNRSSIQEQRQQQQKLSFAREQQQNLSSAQEQQPTLTVDTLKPTETVSADVKPETVSSRTESTPTLAQTTAPPTRVLRSATSRLQHRAQIRQRQLREKEQESSEDDATANQIPETPTTTLPTIQQSAEEHDHSALSKEHQSTTDTVEPPMQEQFDQSTSTVQQQESIITTSPTPIVQVQESSVETPQATTSQSTESTIETTQIPTVKSEQPSIKTVPTPTIDANQINETETSPLTDEHIPTIIDSDDHPRQVHIHDHEKVLNEMNNESIKPENSSLNQEIENNTTVDSFLTNDQTRHLPRILENEQTLSTIDSNILTLTTTHQTLETTLQTNIQTFSIDSKTDETNNSLLYKTNTSEQIFATKTRQVCWRLAKPFDSSFELIENQTLRFVGLLPEFLQTILFGQINDPEIIINTVWFSSICGSCFFFSLIFLSLAAKRLKQSKTEKEIRARSQQLQQYNNQLELERATFERENQKLFDEIEEIKNQPLRDTDEEIFQLRENYDRLHSEWKNLRVEYDNLRRDNDQKQGLIQKHNFDLQKQVENVAYLNDEILRLKQQLEKERETIARLQTNDLSLERFEQLQQIIHELKSENVQLKQDKFGQTDEIKRVQEHAKQLEIDNNELTIKLKQLKDLLEQQDQTIAKYKNVNNAEDSDEENDEDSDEKETETNVEIDEHQQQRELLSTIDTDVEKANQHMRNLHSEIEEKTRRVKELDNLLNQEKDRCRELETKLKVILELRERDTHLHIRQLGQTDAELRKARTDTERVRILQQQLEFKQKQLDDVQKELSNEQTKFSEEYSKLRHEIHEKWMEVKRLTRELDGAKKECEGLRRQITKYAQNDRSSQEKTMHKPIAQHLNNTGRLSSEPETNGSSPPPPPPSLPYQQGENFRPIDHERNDSGAASPSDMFRMRPPLFNIPRPPFFAPFMPPHNPFLMASRFPMPPGGPHGMASPILHLMTNGSAGGSDSNSFEIVDSTNITPNSTSYDAQINGSATSPVPDDEQQITRKVKKAKKSSKKKTKTSATTTVSDTKQDV